jgi:hypothetical protein
MAEPSKILELIASALFARHDMGGVRARLAAVPWRGLIAHKATPGADEIARKDRRPDPQPPLGGRIGSPASSRVIRPAARALAMDGTLPQVRAARMGARPAWGNRTHGHVVATAVVGPAGRWAGHCLARPVESWTG